MAFVIVFYVALRINIMTTSRPAIGIKSFFMSLANFFNPKVCEVEEDYVSLEEAHRMRHCPKDSNDIGDVYVSIYKTFGDIENTDLFKTLMTEMQYAKMTLCKTWTDQHSLPDIPKELDAPFESTIVVGADRLSYTVWVLWFDDRVEVVKPYPNRGTYRSNCEEFESRETADAMPEGVIKAAKITIGVVESDNLLKGYQWVLYQKASEA